jgi:hypothetical protein
MSAVTGSLSGIIRGREPLRLAASGARYVKAVDFIAVSPAPSAAGWILLACALLAVRYRHDPAPSVTLLLQLAAIPATPLAGRSVRTTISR